MTKHEFIIWIHPENILRFYCGELCVQEWRDDEA